MPKAPSKRGGGRSNRVASLHKDAIGVPFRPPPPSGLDGAPDRAQSEKRIILIPDMSLGASILFFSVEQLREAHSAKKDALVQVTRPSLKAAARRMHMAVRGPEPAVKKAKSPVQRPSHYVLGLVRERLLEALVHLDNNTLNYDEAANVLNLLLKEKGVEADVYRFRRDSLCKIRSGKILSKMTGRSPKTRLRRIGNVCPSHAVTSPRPKECNEEDIRAILRAWIAYGTGSRTFLNNHPEYQHVTRSTLEHWKRDDRFMNMFF